MADRLQSIASCFALVQVTVLYYTSAVGGPVITLNIETFSHDPDPSRTGRSVKVRSLDDGSGSDLVRPGS